MMLKVEQFLMMIIYMSPLVLVSAFLPEIANNHILPPRS